MWREIWGLGSVSISGFPNSSCLTRNSFGRCSVMDVSKREGEMGNHAMIRQFHIETYCEITRAQSLASVRCLDVVSKNRGQYASSQQCKGEKQRSSYSILEL